MYDKVCMKFAKQKVMTLTKAKKKANDAFSKYIRTRDAKGEDYLDCVTCDKPYPAFGVGCAQAGHFIPGRHSSVVFDERNAHGQCYNCNINLKGNWLRYEEAMRNIYGQKVIDELKALDKITVQYKEYDYLVIEEIFKTKLAELTKI